MSEEHKHEHPVVIAQTGNGNSAGVSTAEKTVLGNWSWHLAWVNHSLRNIGNESIELAKIEIK